MIEKTIILFLTVVSILFGTGQFYLAMIEKFPIKLVYWHSKTRKPAIWILLSISLVAITISYMRSASLIWAIVPLGIQCLMILMTYKLHQETMFPAATCPKMTTDISNTVIADDMEVALIEVNGDLRAYPLQYVIHHHIVNDQFDDKMISLTYCAMCRTIVAFDVTDIGPLFVASFKNANMIIGDLKTKTFFQQATFESVIGALHPKTLNFYMSQTLLWGQAKQLNPAPKVVSVTEKDLKEFVLPVPVPGVWKRIMKSESTPGLSSTSRDKRFPARTRVIGVPDKYGDLVYLKSEILSNASVFNQEMNLILMALGETVTGFYSVLNGNVLSLVQTDKHTLQDENSGITWDLRGKYLSGPIKNDLILRATSDEYWFSWARFHPNSKVVRINR